MWLLLKSLSYALISFAAIAWAGSKETFITLRKYQKETRLTDIVIVSKDKSIHPCHKLILSAYSPYFEAMFHHHTKENQNNTINLPYADTTIEIILDFIYDPDKTSIAHPIPWNIYPELFEFAELSLSDTLKQAIKEVQLIMLDDFDEFDEAASYIIDNHDMNLAERFSGTIPPIYSHNLNGTNNWFNPTTFSPNSELILTVSHDNIVKIRDISGKELAILKDHSDWIRFTAFSPDSQFIVTASDAKTAKIWDISGKEIAPLKGHSNVIRSAVFSPNGKYIVTASDDNTAKIWDISGKELATLKHNGHVNYAVFSPDSKYIVTAYDANTAKIWDTSGKELATLKGHSDWIRYAVFSLDGQYIVTASYDRTAKIWDISGQGIATLKHNSCVNFAVFSHDSKSIVTASNGNIIKIWDTSGKELTTLKGHSDWIRSAVFNPGGKYIVTKPDGKPAKIWDTSGKEVATFKGHNNLISSAVFSPDGQYIVTGSDKTMSVWFMPPVEFYDNHVLFSYNNDEAKLWLILRHLLTTYLSTVKQDKQPCYKNFIKHTYSLKENLDLSQFILSHSWLSLYFRLLFKDFSSDE